MVEQGDVKLDFDRQNRTGLAEAVFCEGKSHTQLGTICDTIITQQKPMLFTRLSTTQFADLSMAFQNALEYDPISRTASYLGAGASLQIPLAIVSGGSSDLSVAREAARTLNFYGYGVTEIHDVGVAGLWRVTERLEELRAIKIVICVAGMDAALPTVLGGLIGASIIAVPTSVGYGMAHQGETALRALLVSCAAGITVTNIDNGYGAACAAIRILNNFAGE